MQNRQWILKQRPEGAVSASDFEWVERPAPPLEPGEARISTVYLSLDPAARIWIAGPSYMPAVEIGDVMRGIGLGRVQESRDGSLRPGDLVTGLLGWQQYATLPAAALTRIDALPGIPLTAYLHVLGHIGLTAYFGLLDVGRPRSGETLVVSAAAGAVGSLAAQIGKISGCRVVGIAGGPEKCGWLTGELGLDAAVDYKNQDVAQALREATPDGIDVDFENVGGEILDAVLARINQNARIVLCGLISQYNLKRPAPGPSHFARVLTQRARIEGFIVTDYLPRAHEALPVLGDWLRRGRLKYRVEVVKGLEDAPRALGKLFDGSNQGKLILQVSEES